MARKEKVTKVIDGDGRKLALVVVDLRNRPRGPLADCRSADGLGQGQDVLLDLGGHAEESQDLDDAGTG